MFEGGKPQQPKIFQTLSPVFQNNIGEVSLCANSLISTLRRFICIFIKWLTTQTKLAKNAEKLASNKDRVLTILWLVFH